MLLRGLRMWCFSIVCETDFSIDIKIGMDHMNYESSVDETNPWEWDVKKFEQKFSDSLFTANNSLQLITDFS